MPSNSSEKWKQWQTHQKWEQVKSLKTILDTVSPFLSHLGRKRELSRNGLISMHQKSNRGTDRHNDKPFYSSLQTHTRAVKVPSETIKNEFQIYSNKT